MILNHNWWFLYEIGHFWAEIDVFGVDILTSVCNSYEIESCDNCHFNLSHVEIMQPSE